MKKSCQNLTENLLEIQRKMSDFGEIKKQNLPQLLKLHAEICSLIEYGLSFKFDWSQYHSLEKSVKFYSNIQQPSVGFTQYPGAIVPKSGKFVNIMSDKIIDISSIKENGLELTAPREEYRIDFRNLDLGFDAGIRPELVFSPDGKEMVFYYGNGARGAYYIHNMETNQTEKWIEGGGSFFTILARLYFESRKKSFFLCENRLYCFSPRAILRYSASQIIRLPFVFISPRKIELSPDEKKIVVLGEGPLSLIDIESGKVKSLSADATSISVDRESNRLIYQDGNLMEYSFETGQKKLLDTVYYSDATTLVDDGRFCLTEEVDGVVSCTDISHKDQALAKRMHNTIPAASGRIQQIVLKDNGDIVTLSRKGEVRILTKKKAGD